MMACVGHGCGDGDAGFPVSVPLDERLTGAPADITIC